MKLQARLLVYLGIGLLSLFHPNTALGQALADSNNPSMAAANPFMDSSKAEMIGTTAPQLHLQSIDGTWYTPENLRGKVIVLNFWFIDCMPCKLEKPIWNEVVQMYAQDDRVVFLSISRDQDIEAIKAYAQTQKLDTPVIADGSTLIQQFGVEGFPTTLIVDRRGRYSGGMIGGIQKETAQKLIQHALLGKKPDPKNMVEMFQSITESDLDFRDEDGNPVGIFDMISMTGSGQYMQEMKTDAEGKSYTLLRKATPAERAQIREQNKKLFQNSSPAMRRQNKSFDLELKKFFPTATPEIPIRIKDGPQISFADYQQKMKSGKWFEQGILSPKGQITAIELEKRPDDPEQVLFEEKINRANLNDLGSVIGNAVEPFELTDMDGNMIRSQDTSGRVLVCNFWFTSCKPCIAEFPALNRVYQRYKNDPRVVFAAVTFESRERVEAFVERGKYPLDYPIVPENSQFQKQFKIAGAPGNVVIGTDGKILYNGYGTNKLLVEKQLIQAIDNALAQKDPQLHGQISLLSQLFTLQEWADYTKQNPLKN